MPNQTGKIEATEATPSARESGGWRTLFGFFEAKPTESQSHHTPATGVNVCPNRAQLSGEVVNPANNMPELSQEPVPGQTTSLSTDREISNIPRAFPNKGKGKGACPVQHTGATASVTGNPVEAHGAMNGEFTHDGVDDPTQTDRWVYPSSQQFHQALARKGWETPEEHVDMMVAIHNFLNEGCWQEILKWEELHKDACCDPQLLRLRGRPNDLSPKARFLGWFGTPKPFDRHDWVVSRCGREVRYVIDYYAGQGQPDVPEFFVDVRPALDSPQSIMDRIRMTYREGIPWPLAKDTSSDISTPTSDSNGWSSYGST
ncbi:holocytochrome c synthase [Dispira simplex]|nr:holocytochrome c synthase [Dispira simplex]